MCHPTATVNGRAVSLGYPYSLLDWVPEAHSSWSLSVSVKRIPSDMTAGEVGVAQIQVLSKSQSTFGEALDIENAIGRTENVLPLGTLIAGGHPMSSLPSRTRNSDR